MDSDVAGSYPNTAPMHTILQDALDDVSTHPPLNGYPAHE